MVNELLRLLRDIRNFLNWSFCERTFIMNLLIASFLIPITIMAYAIFQDAAFLASGMLAVLGVIIIFNLYEIKQGHRRSKTIYLQIFFITAVVGIGSSLLGSVSSGIPTLAIFLMICYYPVTSIRYTTILGILLMTVLSVLIYLDFYSEILPYSWIWDVAGIGRSGNEVRSILAVTRNSKTIIELIFITTLPWTVLILRLFHGQLTKQTRAVQDAHGMLQQSKDLSDRLLLESQQKQQELQECISQLLVAVQHVGEGHLDVEIPDFGDRPMGRLARGFKQMVDELHIAKDLDEAARLKEQETAKELQESINQLLEVVDQVGTGNLEVIPPDLGNKALGRLSRGLAEMIIKQNINRIEESRHKKAMARTNALVENARNSLIMVDPNGIIRYMNPAAQNMFRILEPNLPISADKILDSACEKLIQDEPLKEVLANPKQMPYHCEIQMGSEWVYIEVTAVYGPNGNFLGPMLAWDIITDKKARSERDRHLQMQVKAISKQLGRASRSLLGVSEQMGETSYKTSHQSQKVVGEAKEIQTNIERIAAALEEMSITLMSKEKLIAQSTEMSNKAVNSSRQASKIITALGRSSMSIGIIIQLINRVTQQINILALNASIQATRAGESGKGFGVVAREVKALAQQTSEATKEIAGQISAIQEDSKHAISAITQVGGIIEKMNNISEEIYRAIEEQSSATHEIAQRMEEASDATQSITMHISEVAQVADDAMQGVHKGRDSIVTVDNIVADLNDLVTSIR